MVSLLKRHAEPASSFQARPLAVTWLVGTLTLVVLPHLPRLPVWIALAVFCLGVYRLMHEHAGWPLPSGWVVALCALLAIFSIMLSFTGLIGRRACIALLLVLLGLKLLEMRTERDLMVLSYIGYFLVITHFLYSQSVGLVVYLMVMVWLLTVTLMHFQHLGDVNRPRLRTNLRQGSLLVVQALPFMVILFIFFPRVDGSLWRLPQDTLTGVSGLSDAMTPGQITELSTSSAVAFRVEFDGAIPPAELQYWRGLVLWDYDGLTWRRGMDRSAAPLQWHQADSSYTYTLTLQPHARSWLFSLDLPYAFIRDQTMVPLAQAGRYDRLGTFTHDFQLQAPRPVDTVRHYTLHSYARYRVGGLGEVAPTRALRLPANLHAGVQQLAAHFSQASRGDPSRVVRRALLYFRDQPFVYTLNPPALDVDPTYEFLFETRRGYCEHFASSFTVLMRAAGIPARVVVGYQGGEVNPLGRHLTVRQSHAHAWSEVWLDSQGWVRVDPTTMVAPERLEMGLEGLPEYAAVPLIIRNRTGLNRLWRTMRFGWDALHHTWNHWVLQYSEKQQAQLMSWLGFADQTWQGLTLALVLLLSALLAIFALRMFRYHTRRDRIVHAYQAFCAKLARRGMVRLASEGPFDFAARVQQWRPELAVQVETITGLYSALRYGRSENAPDLQRLQHAVRAFRP